MTPENLSRAIRSVVDLGVRVKGQQVTITDLAQLQAFVLPDPLIDGPDTGGATAGVSLPQGAAG